MGPLCNLLKWRSRKQPFVPREEDLLAGSTDQDVGDDNVCQHQRSGICEGSLPNSYSLFALISVMLKEDKKEGSINVLSHLQLQQFTRILTWK